MTSQDLVARCEPGACRATGPFGRIASAIVRGPHSTAALVHARCNRALAPGTATPAFGFTDRLRGNMAVTTVLAR